MTMHQKMISIEQVLPVVILDALALVHNRYVIYQASIGSACQSLLYYFTLTFVSLPNFSMTEKGPLSIYK